MYAADPSEQSIVPIVQNAFEKCLLDFLSEDMENGTSGSVTTSLLQDQVTAASMAIAEELKRRKTKLFHHKSALRKMLVIFVFSVVYLVLIITTDTSGLKLCFVVWKRLN